MKGEGFSLKAYMIDGFVKIACITPEMKLADCDFNAQKIIDNIRTAAALKVKICSFPELALTGYTCGDLFLQSSLVNSALLNLTKITASTKDCDIISVIGFPFSYNNMLYNCAAVVYEGSILGIVPKSNIPDYSEFSESRYFTAGTEEIQYVNICGQTVPFGTGLVFSCKELAEFTFGVEICEDLLVGSSPSIKLAENGANLIINLSASNETIGKADYRKTVIKAKSGSLTCAYTYTNAGIGESTTDLVFSGHSLIAENGKVLCESEPYESGMIISDIDFSKISGERRRINTCRYTDHGFEAVQFSMIPSKTELTRKISRSPFIPEKSKETKNRCIDILKMQTVGLMSRFKHIGAKTAVVGLSGGLDSTLALIVTVRAFEMLKLDTKGITAITMPCFGTTDRTYNNACELAKAYNVTLKEINIRKSVIQHFEDIGHDENIHDVTYENSQARERTQILMDYANRVNGIVIGTGDLSELALGWATYNGDHMSMYGVNASIPKTLVRHLVAYEASVSENNLKDILLDILDTPVSPELLPPTENGNIAQKTEDLVGPYELHDFFLYYIIRYGFSPVKIFRLAQKAFSGIYDTQTILKWEKTFYRRFFAQQFKRSCMPDGPKVGSVTLSPRGDFRMPSDASAKIWLNELEKIMEV